MNNKLALFLTALLVSLSSLPASAAAKSQPAAGQSSPFVNFWDEDQISAINKKIESAIATGAYHEALLLATRAADLARANFGATHIEYAKALNNLGWTQQTAGDYKSARESFETALKIYDTKYGANSPKLATTLNNLALLVSFQGDYDTALPLMQRVLTLQESALGADSPELIYTLNNIAAVQSSLGNDTASKATLQRALALHEVKDVAAKSQTLNNLSLIAEKHGDLKTARESLATAIELRHTADPQSAKSADMIELLNNLALIDFELGNTPSAKTALNEALDIAAATLGKQHVDYATTLSNLASIDYQSGNKTAARDSFLRVAETIDRHLENVLPAMSFAEQRAFLQRRIKSTVSYLVSSAKDGGDVSQIYNHLFRWKGLLIETLRWQSALAHSGNSPALAELLVTRNELARLFNKVDPDLDKWQARFQALSRKKADLERSLLSGAQHSRASDILTGMDLQQFLHLLRPKESLIDIYEYEDVSAKREKRYGAFTADSTGAVKFTELATASTLDRQIANWRDLVLSRKMADVETELLRHQLFDQLLATSSHGRMFISPDGELSRFPINIFCGASDLPVRISQLDSPRELAYLRATVRPATRDEATVGAATSDEATVGTATRDEKVVAARMSTEALRGANPADPQMLVIGGVDFGPGNGVLKFPALPGTAKEAKSVIDIATANGFHCDYLTGNAATRTAILAQLPHATIAHLATHGIFSDATTGATTDTESARNPLLFSAIILSAHTPSDSQPDMLTAEELTSTDLHACRLLVLSACETGLGTRETGQGILGLRTSLMAAGARTLIMSLWKVPDLPTTLLMQSFYENLLHKHEPPAVALAHAQQFVRTTGDSAFARPVNWGAWVLVGEGMD